MVKQKTPGVVNNSTQNKNIKSNNNAPFAKPLTASNTNIPTPDTKEVLNGENFIKNLIFW